MIAGIDENLAHVIAAYGISFALVLALVLRMISKAMQSKRSLRDARKLLGE